MSYLILCKQMVDGMALWWRCDRQGYTVNVAEAGRYSKDEAESIARIRGLDFPVPEEEIGKSIKTRTVVTHEEAGNWEALQAYRRRPSPETGPVDADDETPCAVRDDGLHCECWYGGNMCCGCGDGGRTLGGEWPSCAEVRAAKNR